MPSINKSRSKSRSPVKAKRRGAPRKYSPCKGQEIRDPKTKRCRAKKLPGRPKMMRKSKSKSKSKSPRDEEYYIKKYLTDLSDYGVVNMFAAVPQLQRQFRLTKEDAEEVLARWMNGFSETKAASESISPLLLQRRLEREKRLLRYEEEARIRHRLDQIQVAIGKEYRTRMNEYYTNGSPFSDPPGETELEKALEIEKNNLIDELYRKK